MSCRPRLTKKNLDQCGTCSDSDGDQNNEGVFDKLDRLSDRLSNPSTHETDLIDETDLVESEGEYDNVDSEDSNDPGSKAYFKKAIAAIDRTKPRERKVKELDSSSGSYYSDYASDSSSD